MIGKWTAHLIDPVEAENFKRDVIRSKEVLERLRDILKEKEVELGRTEVDIKTYDVPGWEFRQAHKNGQRSIISIIKKLVDLDQQDTTQEI